MRCLSVTDGFGTGCVWMLGNRKFRVFDIIGCPLTINPDRSTYFRNLIDFKDDEKDSYTLILFTGSIKDGEELLTIFTKYGFHCERFNKETDEKSDSLYIDPNHEYPLFGNRFYYYIFFMKIIFKFSIYLKKEELQKFLDFLNTLRDNHGFRTFYYYPNNLLNCVLM